MKKIILVTVVIIIGIGSFFIFSQTRNNNVLNNSENLYSVARCNITANPGPAEWMIGKNNEVVLTWQSQNADTAYLYPPQGGKGGDLITIVMLEGEKVAVSGSKKVLINLPAFSAGYPYDYQLVVKGKGGIALCTARGEKMFRTLEEQKEAENFKMG